MATKLTPAQANEDVILSILTHAGELDLDGNANLVEDPLLTKPRELQNLRSLQSATKNHGDISVDGDERYTYPAHNATSFFALIVYVFPLPSCENSTPTTVMPPSRAVSVSTQFACAPTTTFKFGRLLFGR